MTKKIIQQSRVKDQAQPLELTPTEAIEHLTKYYKKPTKAVIEVLYGLGYTYQQIGELIGLTRQRVQQLYPKPKEGSK